MVVLGHALRNITSRTLLASLTVLVMPAFAASPWLSDSGEIAQTLRSASAKPLSLGAGDFDEDGVPDLIVGYAAPGLGGFLTVHRGDVDAIYPNAPEAKARGDRGSPPAAFLAHGRLVRLPEAPDFIVTGDFDADGHQDIAYAARGSTAIRLLPGDGRGVFGPAASTALPGTLTALTVGEINRPDGLADIAAGVLAPDGPRALVFESPAGALRGTPESFPLPGAPTSLALGYIDEDALGDLAIAAGPTLVMVRGRDRNLSLDTRRQAEAPAAKLDRRTLPFEVASIATGEFGGGPGADLALLGREGERVLLESPDRDLDPSSLVPRPRSPLEAWRMQKLADDLLLLDATSSRIRILGGGSDTDTAALGVEGRPVAALPMRLNTDALADLVVLVEGRVEPFIAPTSPAATFTVTSVNNNGAGSLRDAISLANASPGADSITFSIGTGTQNIIVSSALPTITETVTIDATTQPGYAGVPLIVLRQTGGAAGVSGLRITAGGCTVRGLVIQGFTDNGLILTGAGATSDIVEGCYIGTNQTGTAAFANGDDGIELSNGVRFATIGGTVAAARNVISGNRGDGVFIDGIGASSSNLVEGNYVGTNAAGTAAIPNGNFGGGITYHGFEIADGTTLNTIGGTVAGSGNVISGNAGVGVGIFNPGTGNNLVQRNFLGLNAAGTAALANGFHGVLIRSGASFNTIGGTVTSARNVCSGNVIDGVWITDSGTGSNLLQGNYIGTNAAGTAAVPNGAAGGNHGVEIAFGAQGNTVGGTTPGAGNLVSGNAGAGVGIFNPGTNFNFVQGNLIGTNAVGSLAIAPPTETAPAIGSNGEPLSIRGHVTTGVEPDVRASNGFVDVTAFNTPAALAIGNSSVGAAIVSGAQNNTIGGSDPAARNVISGNGIDGILITQGGTTNNTVQGNLVGTDPTGASAVPNGRGIEIAFGAQSNTIGGAAAGEGNVVSGNSFEGILIANAGTAGNQLQGNLVGTRSDGSGPLGNGGAGVLVSFSQSGSNTIGGATPGSSNRIAFNAGSGFFADSGGAFTISGNSIESNGGLGIDLTPFGAAPNDHCDGDAGPNNLQNSPLLSSAVSGSGSTTVSGTLDSAAGVTFTIELFTSATCDASGRGEGATYLGSASVTTAGSCVGPLQATLPVSLGAGQMVTATATDPAGNTSEFSNCAAVCLLPSESAHLLAQSDTVTFTWDPDPLASSYDLLRGAVAELPVGSGASEICVAPAISGTSATDAAVPDAGEAHWYLARARNACGPGTYGQTSNGAPRMSATCP